VSLEEREYGGQVVGSDEDVRGGEEDGRRARSVDAGVDRLDEPRAVLELENPDAWIAEARHELVHGPRLAGVVVQEDDVELTHGAREETRKRAPHDVCVGVAGHERGHHGAILGRLPTRPAR
jgi:hypothetical protein